jgi:NAD(P)-dependent dehydrogenase (short-subunit alcohol dehydrogenase family)
VLTMTMALAIEHVSDRIRVNCVCPGLRIPMKSAADSDRNWPPIPTEAGR